MDAKKIISVMIVLSVIGLAVSIYSTWEHYELVSGSKSSSFCDVSAEVSCSAVNSSPYSEVMGIPTAAFGALWFAAAIVLLYQIRNGARGFWKNSPFYLFAWCIAGLLTVIWLVYAEFFLIGALCILCTIVHIIVIIMLFLSHKLLQKPVGKYMEDIFYK